MRQALLLIVAISMVAAESGNDLPVLLSTAQANPQNVNFGINLATVSSFLDAQTVGY